MFISNLKSVCRISALRSFFGRRVALALAIALALTAVSQHSSATTLVYKSFNDLMKESDGVIAGHVVSVNSQYSANKEIYTFITLDQLDVLSGSYGESTLTIRVKGGQVGNDISHIVGSPEFTEGEKVVLFINGNGQNMVPLTGWTQGVFRVSQDPATAQEVLKDSDGNRVVGLQNGQVLRDMSVQPEATILKQSSGVLAAAQSQYEGDGGASDSKQTPTVAVQAVQANALKSAPSLSAASFRDTVKNSASLRQSKTALSSVKLMDFTVAGGNVDASVGSKAAPSSAPAAQQAPVAPKHNAVTPAKDQE